MRQYTNCVICGKDITKSRRLKTCGCEECNKKYKKLKFSIEKELICNDCGETFYGSGKTKFCNKCRKKHQKNKKYSTIEQKVICKECNKLIKIQEKNVTKTIPEIIFDICDNCKNKRKELNSINSSNRMKLNNPMYDKKISSKVSKTLRNLYEEKCKKLNIEPKPFNPKDPNKKPETKEETSERMKRNNPMKNPEVVKKMKETTKERIKSGKIIYKRGSQHPLYKGNRPLNKYVRDHLKFWIKDQLQSVNYTCQKCGKQKTALHVHHNIPLFKIIEEFLTKYNIANKNLLSDEKLLVKFTNDIIEYHYNTKDLGIVVCKNCHDQIDKRYHKSNKNENSKKNNKKI